MKKVLITGGAGFIGSNLVNFFLERDWQVFVVDNLLTSTKNNLTPLLSNKLLIIRETDVIEEKFDNWERENFNLIYHLASPASPKQYMHYSIETLLVNSLGTLNLLKLAKKIKNCTFIYASTSEVYGDPLVHPQDENYWGNVNPVGRRSCYDEAKRFGETLCVSFLRKHQLDLRIARIFNTYGPNMEKDDGRVIANFITQALSRDDITVYGKGQQTRSFCYISDLVDGLYAIYEKPVSGEIINLGNDNETKIIDIAKLIKKMTGSKSKIVFESLPEDDPKKRRPDLTKARKLLGYQPKVPLDSGINNTIAYFKKRFDL